MQSIKDVMCGILNCGVWELNKLLETEIDIPEMVSEILANGYDINIYYIYKEAFDNIVWETFHQIEESDPEVDISADFEISYNGALDTHMYISNGGYGYYLDNYPDEIREIEKHMNMKFEEGM